jgi:hypothetical protein
LDTFEKKLPPKADVLIRPGAVRIRQMQNYMPGLLEVYGRDPFIWDVVRAYYNRPDVSHWIMYQRTYEDKGAMDNSDGKFLGLGREGYHLDSGKYTLKSILFLTDIKQENGPFTYIPGSHKTSDPLSSVKNRKLLRNLYAQKPFSLYFKDDEVKKLKMEERSVPITGKKGTLVFAETFGLHKAALLQKGERKILWNYFGD